MKKQVAQNVQKKNKTKNNIHESFCDEPQLTVHYSVWGRSTCLNLLPEQKEIQFTEACSLQLQTNSVLGTQTRPVEPVPPSSHLWLWSLLTILRCHQARFASLSSFAEHVSICSHRTHLWSSQRSLACSAHGFSCDPSWPWWNSGFYPQLHALSSSLLLLCIRE